MIPGHGIKLCLLYNVTHSEFIMCSWKYPSTSCITSKVNWLLQPIILRHNLMTLSDIPISWTTNFRSSSSTPIKWHLCYHFESNHQYTECHLLLMNTDAQPVDSYVPLWSHYTKLIPNWCLPHAATCSQ